MVKSIKTDKAAKKSPMERVEALENTLTGLISAMNQAIQGIENKLVPLTEVVDALAAQVGEEALDRVVQERRASRAAKLSDEKQAALENALLRGELETVNEIEHDTLIVGAEFDVNGLEIPPGRAQITLSHINPDLHAEFLGKGVGDVIQAPAGTFEIRELYKAVLKTPEAVELPAAPALEPDEVLS